MTIYENYTMDKRKEWNLTEYSGTQKRRKINTEENEKESSKNNTSEGSGEIEDLYENRQGKKVAPLIYEGLPIKLGAVVKRVSRSMDEKDQNSSSSSALETIPESRNKCSEETNLDPRQKLLAFKENIAKHATQLQENPEENRSSLSILCQYADSGENAQSLLAIAALLPVFKSLAPSYRIRPLSDAEKREKVSREVANLRDFEENFLRNYRSFLTRLGILAKGSPGTESSRMGPLLAATSITAVCELCMSSLRHFNFNTDLFSIPIRLLGRKPKDSETLRQYTQCIRTIETLLREDGHQGAISLEIVRILCSKIRKSRFRVDESVLNIFLSIAVLDNANPFLNRKSQNAEQRQSRKQRIHLSKKEKKARKDAKEIEEEMRKAEQAVTAKERENFQGQILRDVFKIYLEILRSSLLDSNDSRHLVASVLEGLSKFGPMANLDLVGDFLEVLKELMKMIVSEHALGRHSSSSTKGIYHPDDVRKLLLCVATSFALISNHTESGKLPFSVDLSQFVETLYVILTDVSLDADLELSHRSLRLNDPLGEEVAEDRPAVNVSTRAELLIKCLDFVFFRSKNGSKERVMLFLKRIYMMSLHTPEKTTNASLKFVSKLMHRYGDFLSTLWSSEEKVVEDSIYYMGFEHEFADVNMENSSVNGAVLWENVLLESHYCQSHRESSRSLSKLSK
ncbi:hypothetical protein CXQ85_005158 [Candidozyma haemuli]|uniref:Nucleolar complex-associated protein 3 n=1 Tax=Candidozyma haemuli TaxID=45357 RepID=A0A2V1AYL6_9ASCO|nr:hypothetical protein CXQ85_005158 [[Candida] haemuloni]PVH22586.1 hypothetical protein CXQ85_005158 [[Candida] haemuloni]